MNIANGNADTHETGNTPLLSTEKINSKSDKIKEIVKQLLELLDYKEFCGLQAHINNISSEEEVLSFLEKINAGYNISEQSIGEHLRERQKESVGKQIDFYTNSESKSGLVTFATGGGKTVMFIDLVRILLNTGKKVLILTPSKISLNRARDESNKILIDHGLYFQDEKDLSQDLTIGTWQSILPLIKSGEVDKSEFDLIIDKNEFDLIICDEVHAMLGDEVSKIYSYFDTKIIGYTATPELLNKGVMDFFEENIDTYLVDEAIYDGVLPKINSSLTIKLKSEIFNSLELNSDKTDFTELSRYKLPIESAFEDVFNLIDGELSGKKGIVFFPTVKKSEKFEEFIIGKGLNAKHMDGNTPEEERKEIFRQFENGIIDVLCCSDLLRYSYDSDIIDYAIILDFTMSPAKYMQMIGRPLHGKEFDKNGKLIGPKKEIFIVDMINDTEEIKNRPLTARSLNNVTTTGGESNKNYDFEILSLSRNIPITETLLYFDMKETLDDNNLISVYIDFKDKLGIDTLSLLSLSLEEIESRLTEEQKNVYIFIDLIPHSSFANTINIKPNKLKLNFFDFVKLMNAYKKCDKIQISLKKYGNDKESLMLNTINEFLNGNSPSMSKSQITYFLNNLNKFKLNEYVFKRIYNIILEISTKAFVLEKINELVNNHSSFGNFYFNTELFKNVSDNSLSNKSKNYKKVFNYDLFSENNEDGLTFSQYSSLFENNTKDIIGNIYLLKEKNEDTFFKIYNIILSQNNYSNTIKDLHKLIKYKEDFKINFNETFFKKVLLLVPNKQPRGYRALLKCENFCLKELNYINFIHNIGETALSSEDITNKIANLDIRLNEEEVKVIINMKGVNNKNLEILLDNQSLFSIEPNKSDIYNIIIKDIKLTYLLYKYNNLFSEYTKNIDKVEKCIKLCKLNETTLLNYLNSNEINEIILHLIQDGYDFSKSSKLYNILKSNKLIYFNKLLADKKYNLLNNNFTYDEKIDILKTLLLESNYNLVYKNSEFFEWEVNKNDIFQQIKDKLFENISMIKRFFENEKKYRLFNLEKNDILYIINFYIELFKTKESSISKKDFVDFFEQNKKELYLDDEDFQGNILSLIIEKLNIEFIFYCSEIFSENVLNSVSSEIKEIFHIYSKNREKVYNIISKHSTKSILKLVSISDNIDINILKSIYKKILNEKKYIFSNNLNLLKNLDKFIFEEDFDFEIFKSYILNWSIEYYINSTNKFGNENFEKYRETIKETFHISDEMFDKELEKITKEPEYESKRYHSNNLTNTILNLEYLIKDKNKMLLNIITNGDVGVYYAFRELFRGFKLEKSDLIYKSITENFMHLLFDGYITIEGLKYDKKLFLDLINFNTNNDSEELKKNISLFEGLDVSCFKKYLEKNQNEINFLVENKDKFGITQEIDFLKELNLKYQIFSLNNLDLFKANKKAIFSYLLKNGDLDFIKNSNYFDDLEYDDDLINQVKSLGKEGIDYLNNAGISVEYNISDAEKIIELSEKDGNMFIGLLNKNINNEQLLFSIFEYLVKNRDLGTILNYKKVNEISEIREKLGDFLWDNSDNSDFDMIYIKEILIKRFGASKDDF